MKHNYALKNICTLETTLNLKLKMEFEMTHPCHNKNLRISPQKVDAIINNDKYIDNTLSRQIVILDSVLLFIKS